MWVTIRLPENGGGQRLVEAQIAERLNVSRGPVRDAFRQLKQEGLLQDVPRRGTCVVSLTPRRASLQTSRYGATSLRRAWPAANRRI
ncbi:MAG: GntR family transcriptional regulator [Candidatus Limnocylindrales bacterium]